MNDPATIAQGLDLRLYRRVHGIDAKVDRLPQIVPLEVIIELRARLCSLDNTPPVGGL
jgi:hypothetical protein